MKVSNKGIVVINLKVVVFMVIDILVESKFVFCDGLVLVIVVNVLIRFMMVLSKFSRVVMFVKIVI